MTDALRIYEGGCHCGAVRFRVKTRTRVLYDCSCSICRMQGYLHLIVTRDELELLRGAEVLVDYQFNTRVAHHTFCRVCGVRSFYVPRSHPDGYSINARCLDGAPLDDFTIAPFDGANWEAHVGSIR